MPIRNLACNPSFEATAPAVEVRRNYIRNPLPVSGAYYAAANAATVSYVGDYLLVTCAPGVTDSGINLSSNVTVNAGEKWTISIEVEGVVTGSWRFSVQDSGFNDATDASSSDISIAAGEIKRISHTATATATGGSVFYLLRRTSSGTETVKVRRVMLEKSPVAGDYFDRTTSPDPDLTPAATGTPDASPAILTGLAVANVGMGNTEHISSTRWSASGARSARIISTNATSQDSWLYLAGPWTMGGLSGFGVTFTPGQTYTALVKYWLPAPLTGSLSPIALRLQAVFNAVTGWTGATDAMSAIAPNVAGEGQARLTFTVPANAVAALVRFGLGAYPGNGDVWIDNLMLVEGVYDGPYRDGDSPGWAWQGLPHQSPSVGYPRP